MIDKYIIYSIAYDDYSEVVILNWYNNYRDRYDLLISWLDI
jgi:hypothetical protein